MADPLQTVAPFLIAAAIQLVSGFARLLVGAFSDQYLRNLETTLVTLDVPGVTTGDDLPKVPAKELLPSEYESDPLRAFFSKQGEAVTALANIPVLILPLISQGIAFGAVASVAVAVALAVSFGTAALLIRMDPSRYIEHSVGTWDSPFGWKRRAILRLGVVTPWIIGANLVLGLAIYVAQIVWP